MEVRYIDLVGESGVVAVIEAEHSDIHLDSRIIVQKDGQTWRQAYVEIEVALICSCYIVAGSTYDFRLAAAEL